MVGASHGARTGQRRRQQRRSHTVSRQGRLRTGRLLCRENIAIDPSYPYSYAQLAPARWRQGRAIEAIPLEEKAIRLSPRDPFVDLWYRDLGMAYLLLGRDAEAVPWLEKAVQANDKVYFYHEFLAAAYALTGRLDAAHKEMEATLRLNPGNTIAKVVAGDQLLGSTESYRKQFDHVVDGLRLAGMPEN